LLIALSQIVLRLKTPPEKLRVKMWFFPVLSILTVAGILGVLVQMAFDSSARVQFWLSLLSWAVVLALYFAGKWWRRRVDPPTANAKSGLVLPSETAWEPQVFDTQQHTDPEQAAE
jgi:GABA permease